MSRSFLLLIKPLPAGNHFLGFFCLENTTAVFIQVFIEFLYALFTFHFPRSQISGLIVRKFPSLRGKGLLSHANDPQRTSLQKFEHPRLHIGIYRLLRKRDFFHPIHRAVYLCISLVRKCKPTESPPHYFALIFSCAKIRIILKRMNYLIPRLTI
jgi:hypothetical protein